MFLLANPNCSRWWRFIYRFGSREKLLSFGTYPDVKLGNARDYRDEARSLLKSEKAPAMVRRTEKLAAHALAQNTFEVVAREFIEKQRYLSGRQTNMPCISFAAWISTFSQSLADAQSLLMSAGDPSSFVGKIRLQHWMSFKAYDRNMKRMKKEWLRQRKRKDRGQEPSLRMIPAALAGT